MPTIQIWVDGAWADVTGDVLNEQRVSITRLSGWQAQDTGAQPSTCAIVLLNQGDPGPWSHLTPGATYYGKVGVGTPVRVLKGSEVRFWGEISGLRPSADSTGNLAWVEVEVRGRLGRQSVGSKPIRSPLYRTVAAAGPVAYWSLEEGPGATRAASAGHRTVKAAEVTGNFGFGADPGLPGAADLPSPASGSTLRATVPSTAYPAGYDAGVDLWSVVWAMSIPAAPATTLTVLEWRSYGTVVRWALQVTSTGMLALKGFNSAGATAVATVDIDMADPFGDGADGYGVWALINVATSDLGGGDYSVGLVLSQIDGTAVALSGGTLTGAVPREPRGTVTVTGSTETQPCSIGHFAVFAGSAGVDAQAARGWPGEVGYTRLDRVCDENDVDLVVRGEHLAGNGALGAQPRGTLLAVVQDTAAADGGMLFDARDMLAVEYTTRMSLYNQVPTLALDYAASQLHRQLAPADDTQLTRNDVTVTRSGGSSGRAVIKDGDPYHQTTEDPPAGIGVWDVPVAVNVASDEQCDDQAGWYAHLGATKEPRYGEVVVKLHASAFTGDPDLAAAALAVDIGRVISIANAPSWCPPGGIDLLVHGYTEVIDQHTHEITYRTAPARPWEVWALNTGGSTIAAALTTTGTSVKLATSSGPPWSTTDEPYHISIGGEAMTVTTMSTDSPTYVAAGAASHADNASISPALPAGVQAGDAMVLVAAIRNTGAAIAATPAGWTVLSSAYNAFRVYGRYYQTGDAAPTVTFSGGAAGDTTSGFIFAIRGMSLDDSDARNNATNDSPENQSNSSAQNVAYPAMSVRRHGSTVLYVGWKQDDFTSATGPGTEILEASITTGNDQSLVAYRDIQSTATDVTAGTITITGGAAAISRVIMLALRPLQTATVTRSVNGVVATHAVGEAVNAWRPGVIAL